MAQINFPAASESPWYNPDNGVTYEYVGGTWRTVTDNGSSLDDIYVKEIGDTMTGELILYGNPAQNLGATPKQYVDTEITSAISGSEGSETGRLDGRYLRKDSAAGDQTVASTGTITFDGLVEARSGVKFDESGTAATANIYKTGAKYIQFGGNNRTLATFAVDINNVGNGATFGDATCQLSTTEPNINLIKNVYYNGGHGGGQNLSLINNSVEVNTAAQRVCLYQADSGAQQSGKLYAYYSAINSSDSSDAAYNFYAARNAPNFFGGDTYIGGTTARNTRELWESLLTEDQKEQLSAGTLAIPANVSSPGDGSFVRQWWYNQQSAEDQALIDSGELDYPTHLAAATFTDTFDLGDNTNITLAAGGKITVSNGIQFTGGTAATAVNGMYYGAGSNTLRITSDSTDVAEFFSSGKITFGNPAKDNGGVTVRGNVKKASGQSHVEGFGNRLIINDTVGTAFGYLYDGGVAASADITTLVGYGVRNINGSILNSPDTFRAFSVDGTATFGTKNIGYYSGIADAADTFNFYAAGNAPNYFAGITEHASGVKVTGGTDPTVASIYGAPGSINFSDGTERRCSMGPFNTLFDSRSTPVSTNNNNSGYVFKHSNDTSADVNSVSCINANLTANLNNNTVGNVCLFETASVALSNYDNVERLSGFRAVSSLFNKSANTAAFRAELAIGDGTNYNFYAEGNAPNYFAGSCFLARTTYSTSPKQVAGDATAFVPGVDNYHAINASSNTKYVASSHKAAAAPHFEFWNNDSGAGRNVANISTDSANLVIENKAGGSINIVPTSDYRVKTDVTDLPSAVEAIKQIRPISFINTLNPGVIQKGFIAHELQEHVPEAVRGTKDATEAIGTLADYDGTVLETEVAEPGELTYTEDITDEYGVTTATVRTRTWTATGTRPVYQGVDQTKLIPLLTKALQEALERIEALEAAQ